MSPEEIIDEWVGAHDELERDGNDIRHDGKRLGKFNDEGRCSLGPEDGGVRGDIVEVDGEWLIVDGSQACFVGIGEEHHYENARIVSEGTVQWRGKFAVKPWQPRIPEVDGPLPEE